MNLINQITQDARQRQIVPLDDGTSFEISLYYIPMQLGWFIEEIIYGDFKLESMRVVNSPNMLFQFKNFLPFGLACISIDNREPSQKEDFSSGQSQLFVLTQIEMKEYEAYLSE